MKDKCFNRHYALDALRNIKSIYFESTHRIYTFIPFRAKPGQLLLLCVTSIFHTQRRRKKRSTFYIDCIRTRLVMFASSKFQTTLEKPKQKRFINNYIFSIAALTMRLGIVSRRNFYKKLTSLFSVMN